MIKVCHVTSVHQPEDVRIFQKECVSLAKAGYDITLVQQGSGVYEKSGVHLVGYGERPASRVKRMLFAARAAYRKALEVDADVYHLHDPELLPYGLKLKRKGSTVIFDSHEDVSAQILEKYWIPAPLRKLVAGMFRRYEARVLKRLDGAVSVTPHICQSLRQICPRVEMVCNYPLWEELPPPSFQSRKIVFPGLISEVWCIDVLLKAMESVGDVTLELRSGNVEKPYYDTLVSLPAWKKVNFPGKVSHREVLALLRECMCGIALADYTPNVGGKQGTLGNTKIFEYMMAGLPVVCTDFVLWKEIVDRWQCGICVPPRDADQIASAIRYLLDHPEEARRMGENGRRAVKEAYNWAVEEKKLLALYKDILKD